MSSSPYYDDSEEFEEFVEYCNSYEALNSKIPTSRRERRRIRDNLNPLEMDECLFLKTFHLTKEAFLFILKKVEDKLHHGIYVTKTPNILKLAVTLKFCADGSFQRGIGSENTFGVAQPTISVVLTEMFEVMEETLCPEFIDISNTPAQQHEAKLHFYKKSGLPGVIGIIDGTQIQMMSPRKSAQSLYRNNKGFFSINTMIVCDHKMNIRYINAKHPGSCGISEVFEKSKLKTYLETQYKNGQKNTWLLGNENYELQPYLLTPYTDAQKDSIESRYNDRHEKCRQIMQDVINIYRNRWRCLLGTYPLHYAPSKCTKIINVCAALHNICIKYNVKLDDEILQIPTSVPEIIDLEDFREPNKKAVKIRSEVARSILS